MASSINVGSEREGRGEGPNNRRPPSAYALWYQQNKWEAKQDMMLCNCGRVRNSTREWRQLNEEQKKVFDNESKRLFTELAKEEEQHQFVETDPWKIHRERKKYEWTWNQSMPYHTEIHQVATENLHKDSGKVSTAPQDLSQTSGGYVATADMTSKEYIPTPIQQLRRTEHQQVNYYTQCTPEPYQEGGWSETQVGRSGYNPNGYDKLMQQYNGWMQ